MGKGGKKKAKLARQLEADPLTAGGARLYGIGWAGIAGKNQDDVPALLRRIADDLESRPYLSLRTLVIGYEVNEFGYLPEATAYLGPKRR